MAEPLPRRVERPAVAPAQTFRLAILKGLDRASAGTLTAYVHDVPLAALGARDPMRSVSHLLFLRSLFAGAGERVIEP